MFKVITGKEALKRIADGEEVYFRERDNEAWGGLTPDNWSVAEFLFPDTSCVFAINTEPMRRVFHWGTVPDVVPGDKYELRLDVAEFAGKAIAITVEEIEQ